MYEFKFEYKKRKREIDDFFLLLSAMDDTNISMKNSDEFKVLKATTFLLLYNLIENSIKLSFSEIGKQIQNSSCDYTSLNDKMKSHYINRQSRMIRKLGDEKLPDKIKQIVDSVLNKGSLEMPDVAFSGNVDVRKIYYDASKIGITLNDSFRKYGDSLLTVKDKRNNLSHGDISFQECGRDYSLTQLKKYRDDTFIVIEHVLSEIESYITNQSYKISPPPIPAP